MTEGPSDSTTMLLVNMFGKAVYKPLHLNSELIFNSSSLIVHACGNLDTTRCVVGFNLGA